MIPKKIPHKGYTSIYIPIKVQNSNFTLKSRNVNVDFRYNKIKHINLHESRNTEFDSSQSETAQKIKNITLNLGGNPLQCDCDLINFVKSTKTEFI